MEGAVLDGAYVKDNVPLALTLAEDLYWTEGYEDEALYPLLNSEYYVPMAAAIDHQE